MYQTACHNDTSNMFSELTSQLKKVRTEGVNPSAEWVKSNRAVLLSQIKNTIPLENDTRASDRLWNALSIFVPRQFVFSVVRPVAALLVVAVTITTAYTGTVKASYESLPGDTLYPAKRLVENIPVTVASIVGDTSTETKLRAENAKHRAVEASQLVKTNDPNKIAKVSQAVNDLKNELNTINATLDSSKSKQDTALPAVAIKDVKQSTDEIKNVLQDVKTNLLSTATSSDDTAVTQQVADTKNLVKDVSVNAVEALVAKHLDGDSSVSKDEVTKIISNTLQNVASDASQSQQTVAGAKSLVESVKVEVKDLTAEAQKQKDPVLNSTTQQVSQQVSSVANLTQTAVAQTQQVSQAVGQKVAEANTLLGSGDLVKAVDAVKQVNQATQASENISDVTVQKTQTVLPIVQVIKDVVATGATTSVGTSSIGTLLNTLSSTTSAATLSATNTAAIVKSLLTSTTPPTTPTSATAATSSKTSSNK